MENKKLTLFRNSLNYGIILGFTLVIISVISYLFGTMESTTGQRISSIFQYVIIIIGIIWGTKTLRTSTDGFISYGRALGSGTLIATLSSVILAVYTFIFMKYIDPSAIEKMMAIAEESMTSKGLSDEQVEMSMKFTRTIMNPAFLAIGTIWTYTFMGFLFSLFTSIFLQKKGPSVPWTTGTTVQGSSENKNAEQTGISNEAEKRNDDENKTAEKSS